MWEAGKFVNVFDYRSSKLADYLLYIVIKTILDGIVFKKHIAYEHKRSVLISLLMHLRTITKYYS